MNKPNQNLNKPTKPKPNQNQTKTKQKKKGSGDAWEMFKRRSWSLTREKKKHNKGQFWFILF